MTPEQKIKWAILMRASEHGGFPLPEVTEQNVDDLYDKLREDGNHYDATEDVRGGQVETEIDPDWSRHFESESVASQMPDGSWVGWTYWYGGGKHAEPSAVDWKEYAYDLECTGEKTVVIRMFKKK